MNVDLSLFEDARAKFDVRFYLVSILFIIFDLEIMFLFPWSVSLNGLGLWGLLIMFFFLFILTVGFLL
jgi:NADH-quinone oxidoreductase subunit A